MHVHLHARRGGLIDDGLEGLDLGGFSVFSLAFGPCLRILPRLELRRRCDMLARLHGIALGAFAILAAAGPLFAHHAWPVDRSKEVTVKGTVTAYDWSNPHVMIALDVRTSDGKVEKWNVGGPSTSRMAANRWDRNTLEAGDAITAIGYRFTDGSNVLRLEKIVMSDGKELLLYGRR
jgi:hypothetical protein